MIDEHEFERALDGEEEFGVKFAVLGRFGVHVGGGGDEECSSSGGQARRDPLSSNSGRGEFGEGIGDVCRLRGKGRVKELMTFGDVA